MANDNNFTQRAINFVRSLERPYKWAKEKGIQPWFISRLRHGRVKTITAEMVAALINAAEGQLTWEDPKSKIGDNLP